jgi:tape measure domain-containing protein
MTILTWELQASDSGLSSTMDDISMDVDKWRENVDALVRSYEKLARSALTREQAEARQADLATQRTLRIQQAEARLEGIREKNAQNKTLAEQRLAQATARTSEAQARAAATAVEQANRTQRANDALANQTNNQATKQATLEARQIKAQEDLADSRDRRAQRATAAAAREEAAIERQAEKELRAHTRAAQAHASAAAVIEQSSNRSTRAIAAQGRQVTDLNDRITRVARDTDRAGGLLSTFWDRALGTAGGIILYRAFDLVAQGIGAITSQIVEGPAKMEQYRTAFANMVGGIEAANQQIEQTTQFAIKTPFNVDELLHYQQMLSAVGVQAQDLIPLLRDVGDAVAAAGGGTDEMGKAVLAVSQIIARGKVSAQEINQLSNANVTGWRILADFLGVTQAEVMKMSEEGMITADIFLDAFHEFASTNYAGMMERQARTFLGLMSNIRDVGFVLGETFGEKAMNTITERLGGFVDWLTTPEVAATLADWGDKFERIVNLVFNLADAGGQALQGFFASIRPLTDWLGELIGALPADIEAQEAAYNRAAAGANKMPPILKQTNDELSANKAEIEAIQDALRHLGDAAQQVRWNYDDQIDPLRQSLELIERQYQLQNDQADIAELNDRIRRNTLLGGDWRSSMGAAARESVIRDTADLARKQREIQKNEMTNGLRDRIAELEAQRDADLRYIDGLRNDLADRLDELQDDAKNAGTKAGTDYATSFTAAVQEAWETFPEFGGPAAMAGSETSKATTNLFEEAGKKAGDAFRGAFGDPFGGLFDPKMTLAEWLQTNFGGGSTFAVPIELGNQWGRDMRAALLKDLQDNFGGDIATFIEYYLVGEGAVFNPMGLGAKWGMEMRAGMVAGFKDIELELFASLNKVTDPQWWADFFAGKFDAGQFNGPGGGGGGGGAGSLGGDSGGASGPQKPDYSQLPGGSAGMYDPAATQGLTFEEENFLFYGRGYMSAEERAKDDVLLKNNIAAWRLKHGFGRPTPYTPGTTTGPGWDRGVPAGGTRALGGRVDAGRSYWVGEVRPEVFTPDTSGYIHAGNGGGSGSMEVLHRCPDCNRRWTHAEIGNWVAHNPERMSQSLGSYMDMQ